MEKVDLKIPGKQGPFALRKMKTKEMIEFSQKATEWELDRQYLEIVQRTLVYAKSKKPVYQPNQRNKMDEDLGGGTVMSLGNQALQYNRFDELMKLGQKVEDAEKN